MPYLDSINRELPFNQAETSRDAAVKARDFVGRQGVQVLCWFEGRGAYGGTQREAAEALGIGRPSICARVNALEAQGCLVKSEQRRLGCAVYTAVQQ